LRHPIPICASALPPPIHPFNSLDHLPSTNPLSSSPLPNYLHVADLPPTLVEHHSKHVAILDGCQSVFLLPDKPVAWLSVFSNSTLSVTSIHPLHSLEHGRQCISLELRELRFCPSTSSSEELPSAIPTASPLPLECLETFLSRLSSTTQATAFQRHSRCHLPQRVYQ